MIETAETQIINLEQRLRQAMLASDVNVLDELLSFLLDSASLFYISRLN